MCWYVRTYIRMQYTATLVPLHCEAGGQVLHSANTSQQPAARPVISSNAAGAKDFIHITHGAHPCNHTVLTGDTVTLAMSVYLPQFRHCGFNRSKGIEEAGLYM